METRLHPLGTVPDSALAFVVAVAREGGELLMVRHRLRPDWEFPGGKIEPGETPAQAAARELWEETGAEGFTLNAEFLYVAGGTWGQVYTAQVTARGPLPPGEIAEVRCFAALPADLGFTDILPVIYAGLL